MMAARGLASLSISGCALNATILNLPLDLKITSRPLKEMFQTFKGTSPVLKYLSKMQKSCVLVALKAVISSAKLLRISIAPLASKRSNQNALAVGSSTLTTSSMAYVMLASWSRLRLKQS
jgi:lipid II:glycine glycyltransferase (peptidoglycan interpeptide bridge formation enzyme)